MPVCPKCKRQYAAAPPVMLPKCPSCGFDPARPGGPAAATGPSLEDQIDRGLKPTADISRSDPTAKEIHGGAKCAIPTSSPPSRSARR